MGKPSSQRKRESRGCVERALKATEEMNRKLSLRVETLRWLNRQTNEQLEALKGMLRKAVDETNKELGITDDAYDHPFKALIEAIR